jgi:transcriptional regulator with XRE-family HTH domain
MQIGPLIKTQRHKKKLTQMQLAVQAKVSLPTIQNLESGKGNPTLSLLTKVCAPLDLSIEPSSEEPDWGLLVRCGLPLGGSPLDASTKISSTPLTPQRLAEHIHKALKSVRIKKRIQEALASFIWAIQKEYASFYAYSLATPQVEAFLKKHPLKGRIIKLKRMTSERLSFIL